jgi:Holliday junction resolvase
VIYRSIKKNLKAKGIEIYDVYRNLKSVRAEFDVVAVNGKQVIVVEVKNKLKQDHIDYFETRLPLFKKEFPEFAEYELLE